MTTMVLVGGWALSVVEWWKNGYDSETWFSIDICRRVEELEAKDSGWSLTADKRNLL